MFKKSSALSLEVRRAVWACRVGCGIKSSEEKEGEKIRSIFSRSWRIWNTKEDRLQARQSLPSANGGAYRGTLPLLDQRR